MAGKMDSVSIRLPYKNLIESEVELVGLDLNDDESELKKKTCDSSPSDEKREAISMKGLVLCCMVAAGVQFGWALQLSLLTPYIQTLGIQHAFSSFIWLCGPITGLVGVKFDFDERELKPKIDSLELTGGVFNGLAQLRTFFPIQECQKIVKLLGCYLIWVQPCVGIWSDKCYSKYGRRRPFIFVGALMISVSVIIIGFSADIGYFLGDSKENCSTYRGTRTRAAIIFVIGFWMLDLANNTVQGPARALLADLAGDISFSFTSL
ncbi:hypothetical protein IFM89_018419 [Coptis chinensis]|uniref:Sucrose transporter n=1 Tax=Coptis chinensis TaxID=261450 RepID=A0A835H3S0_9MAGN|nr:hypothetical protein IFM89_018419 [Coptis chinensis]